MLLIAQFTNFFIFYEKGEALIPLPCTALYYDKLHNRSYNTSKEIDYCGLNVLLRVCLPLQYTV